MSNQNPLPMRPEPRESRPEPRTASQRFAAESTRTVEQAARTSMLGPTLRFRGELTAQEDLVVEGTVDGSLTHTQTLSIGAAGWMRGDIRARIIIIDGKVDGDLYASESVTVRATARVQGNISAPKVAITEGAFFLGQIAMQPSGAAVEEHSARPEQTVAAAEAVVAEPLDQEQIERLVSGARS